MAPASFYVILFVTSSVCGLDVHVAFMAPSGNNAEGVDVSAATSVPGIACAVEKIKQTGILPGVNLK